MPKLAPLALALSTALLLTACGGDKKAADTQAPTTLAAVQEVTINNGAEPESLDPHKVSGVPEANILRQMLVGLTTTDNEGKTIPGMAEKWEGADNKTWTFHLRDAKWSNGDAVTADDFVYSFRRLIDPATASPYASYLTDIKIANADQIEAGKASPDTLGVRAIDAKTLEITLSEPVPYLPDTLIHTAVLPVHRATVEKFADKWTQPENIVVNGAYKLQTWQVNERITLARNPGYYDNANTTIDTVNLLAITDATASIQRYKAGELDITYDVPPDQFEQLKAELGSQIVTPPRLCTYYYEFNHTKPPFNDVRVRRALSLAMDRDIVVNSILKQGQTVAYQFTPEATHGIENFSPEWKNWDKPTRLAEAKKLLNEAGYTDTNPLKFELLYNTNEEHRKLAVAASSFWKEGLGNVEVTLNNQEWKTYLETRRKQQFDLSRGGWCADYNEASSFLNVFKSGNSNNNGKYSSPAFDAIMNQALGSDVTVEARAKLYQAAEKQLDAEAASIFVYQYVSPRLIKPTVTGFSDKDPLGGWQVKYLKKMQ